MCSLTVEHEQARVVMRELDDQIAKLAHAIQTAEELQDCARAARKDFERVRDELRPLRASCSRET